jgi:hypothetical protein
MLAIDEKLARLAYALIFCDDPGTPQGVLSEFRQCNGLYVFLAVCQLVEPSGDFLLI